MGPFIINFLFCLKFLDPSWETFYQAGYKPLVAFTFDSQLPAY